MKTPPAPDSYIRGLESDAYDLRAEVARLTAELTTAHSNGYREGAEAARAAAVKYHESRMQMWKESGFPAAAHIDAHETSVDAIRALPLPTAPDHIVQQNEMVLKVKRICHEELALWNNENNRQSVGRDSAIAAVSAILTAIDNLLPTSPDTARDGEQNTPPDSQE